MYQVKFSFSSIKTLKKLDKATSRLIFNWIEKNLINCIDPRQYGKPLKGNLKGLWRYRVGDYRIIAEIFDNELIIEVVEIGHRKEIYR